MTVQRILIVSGTHGNEINPVWAVKQFNIKENSVNNGIEYEYIIGNPAAYEKGCRYIDVDLNRSFKESENVDQHKNFIKAILVLIKILTFFKRSI